MAPSEQDLEDLSWGLAWNHLASTEMEENAHDESSPADHPALGTAWVGDDRDREQDEELVRQLKREWEGTPSSSDIEHKDKRLRTGIQKHKKVCENVLHAGPRDVYCKKEREREEMALGQWTLKQKATKSALITYIERVAVDICNLQLFMALTKKGF